MFKMSGEEKMKEFAPSEMNHTAQDYDNEGYFPIEDYTPKVEAISETFAKMTCINGNFQLEMIESSAFREFLQNLNPRFQLNTLETLKSDCLNIYRDARMRVKEIMTNQDQCISLSVEKLKSRDRNCYFCLAAYFIDDTWKLNRWPLLVWSATSYNVSDLVLKLLKHWQIEEKISSITFKTDTYIDDTVDKVKDYVQRKKALWLNGRLFHVCCWDELINSMAWDAFDLISDTIDKVDEFLDEHNASNQTQLTSDHVSVCVNQGRILPHWNLNYSRLKRALELHSLGDISLPHNYPLSEDEWKKVETISNLVDKLKNIGRIVSETQCLNPSFLLSKLLELRESLSYKASISDSSISMIYMKVLQKLDKYGKDSFILLAIAAVLDPRCKMMYIEYLSSRFPLHDYDLQLSTISEAVHVLFGLYAASTLPPQADSTSDSDNSFYDDTSESEKEDHPSKKRKVVTPKKEDEGNEKLEKVKTHLHGYQQFVQPMICPPKSDLERYLGEPVVPWSEELNSLDWWKEASGKYPVLSKMARDVLTIFLSSCDAFFAEERKVDSRVTAHGQAMANALTCIRSWLPKD